MKRECSINELARIEAMIKSYGLFTIAHESNYGGIAKRMGDDFNTRLYVVVYEVYLDRKAEDMLARNNVAMLMSIKTAYIRLCYDYRVRLGSIDLRNDMLDSINNVIPGFYKKVNRLKYDRLLDKRPICDIIDI